MHEAFDAGAGGNEVANYGHRRRGVPWPSAASVPVVARRADTRPPGPERIRFASAILAFYGFAVLALEQATLGGVPCSGPPIVSTWRPKPIGTPLRPIPFKGRNLMGLVSI
jgi:hypothetical protein